MNGNLEVKAGSYNNEILLLLFPTHDHLSANVATIVAKLDERKLIEHIARQPAPAGLNTAQDEHFPDTGYGS